MGGDFALYTAQVDPELPMTQVSNCAVLDTSVPGEYHQVLFQRWTELKSCFAGTNRNKPFSPKSIVLCHPPFPIHDSMLITPLPVFLSFSRCQHALRYHNRTPPLYLHYTMPTRHITLLCRIFNIQCFDRPQKDEGRKYP